MSATKSTDDSSGSSVEELFRLVRLNETTRAKELIRSLDPSSPQLSQGTGDVDPASGSPSGPSAAAKVTRLRDLGAAKDPEGHSLIHWAALFPDLELLQLLIETCQCDVLSTVPETYQSPLMWSLTRPDNFHIHRYLIAQTVQAGILWEKRQRETHGNSSKNQIRFPGTEVLHRSDSLGATAFIIAVQHGILNAALLMLSKDENLLYDEDQNGCTAIHWACFRGFDTMVKAMIGLSADFSVQDSMGMTPLHRGIMGGAHTAVRLVLDGGLNFDSVDLRAGTSKYNSASPINLEVFVKNGDGQTAVDMARDSDPWMFRTMLSSLEKRYPQFVERLKKRSEEMSKAHAQKAADRVNDPLGGGTPHDSSLAGEDDEDGSALHRVNANAEQELYDLAEEEGRSSSSKYRDGSGWLGRFFGRVRLFGTSRFSVLRWAGLVLGCPLGVSLVFKEACENKLNAFADKRRIGPGVVILLLSWLMYELFLILMAISKSGGGTAAHSSGGHEGDFEDEPQNLFSDILALIGIIPAPDRGLSNTSPHLLKPLLHVSIFQATFAFVSFVVVCFLPPGGTVAKGDGLKANITAYMRSLEYVEATPNYGSDEDASKTPTKKKNAMINPSARLCDTCFIVRHLRMKHCRTSEMCVPEMDHYCMWINNCVGQGNHRAFLVFILSTCWALVLGMMSIVQFLVYEKAVLNPDIMRAWEHSSGWFGIANSVGLAGLLRVPDPHPGISFVYSSTAAPADSERGSDLPVAEGAAGASPADNRLVVDMDKLYPKGYSKEVFRLFFLFMGEHVFHFVTFTTIIFVLCWLGGLAQYQLGGVASNLTTNEMINLERYQHFWSWDESAKKRVFRNRWSKGSSFRNCIDFWWRRRRCEEVVNKSGASTPLQSQTSGVETEMEMTTRSGGYFAVATKES